MGSQWRGVGTPSWDRGHVAALCVQAGRGACRVTEGPSTSASIAESRQLDTHAGRPFFQPRVGFNSQQRCVSVLCSLLMISSVHHQHQHPSSWTQPGSLPKSSQASGAGFPPAPWNQSPVWPVGPCCPTSPTWGQRHCLDTASIVVYPCGTYLIQIYDIDLL